MINVRNVIFKVQSLRSLGKYVGWANVSRCQIQSIAALPHVQLKSNGILQNMDRFNTCTSRGFCSAHTEVRNETLMEYLTEELSEPFPTEVDEFESNFNADTATFTKQLNNESIRIEMKVIYRLVDFQLPPDVYKNAEKSKKPVKISVVMQTKPDYEMEISRGTTPDIYNNDEISNEAVKICILQTKPDFKMEISRGNTTLRLDLRVDTHNMNGKIIIDDISVCRGKFEKEVVDMALYDSILDYLFKKGLTLTLIESLMFLSEDISGKDAFTHFNK